MKIFHEILQYVLFLLFVGSCATGTYQDHNGLNNMGLFFFFAFWLISPNTTKKEDDDITL